MCSQIFVEKCIYNNTLGLLYVYNLPQNSLLQTKYDLLRKIPLRFGSSIEMEIVPSARLFRTPLSI